MRRRDFFKAIGGAAALWPVTADAQRRRPLVGWLQTQPVTTAARFVSAFLQGMADHGYVEGRDVDFERRYAGGDLKRLPALASELVALKPDIMLTTTSAAAIAITKVTSSIPVVATTMVDPIAFGLAASQARPGGQVTGILITLDTLPGKQLATVLELLPGATKVGVLANPLNPVTAINGAGTEDAAKQLHLTMVRIDARTAEEIDAAFQEFSRQKVDVVVVLQDVFFIRERARISTLAIAAHLPTMYGFREHVEAGGLVSYGISMAENHRRAASFVVKILKGSKPGDLPIEFPVRLELLVNLKTAKAIGLTVSESFLIRADEVIE